MTFVGKILVFVIMLFAVFFLAFSVVVFSTERDWKAAHDKLKTAVDAEKAKVTKAQSDLDDAQKALEQAKASHEQEVRNLTAQLQDLQNRIAAAQKEVQETRDNTTRAQQSLEVALREAENKRNETDLLRRQLAAVQQQSNEFKITQTELNDQIRLLQRELETAKRNNADLRARESAFRAELRRHGLSDNYAQLVGVSAPPDVDGEIKRVDARGQNVEISLGRDDGIEVGHILQVWRTKPTPSYIGRILIKEADADQAVGTVIGNTFQGKKIQEGDIVSSQIKPRG